MDFGKYCIKKDTRLTNMLALGINTYAKLKNNAAVTKIEPS